MPAPILDFHTHAQDCFAGFCCVPRWVQPFLRSGPGRVFEAFGFPRAMAKSKPPDSMERLGVMEMQSRFAAVDFEGYLRGMRDSGVTHACALPVEPMARTADLLKMTAGHPEVIAFGSVDFDAGDPLQQLDEHLAAGIKGVKLHPIAQSVEPDDERVIAIFERLKGTELPVLFHTGRARYFLGRRPELNDAGEPSRLKPLLARFPEQPVVLGHMGLFHSTDDAIQIAADHPNAYLEISMQSADVLVEALKSVGPSRLLLGSDWPASRARSEIAQVKRAVRGDAVAERAILYENGAALLRRVGVDLPRS